MQASKLVKAGFDRTLNGYETEHRGLLEEKHRTRIQLSSTKKDEDQAQGG